VFEEVVGVFCAFFVRHRFNCSTKRMCFAPALPLEEVFDPTGAGDTFAGGFAGFITSEIFHLRI
jgi:hypothetical protein